ncbi:hypothetical protein [Streptomyces xanthophaeus]|uniref:hypothetical protein n=1 Tax=Streptomyces xanthophaeus TaxID=67385 RepID=UPI0026483A68|nr:hypothetical protein [Streptomyces xanthophaeus]WKD31602.1 hypothetical protein KO717_06300 [Streptomyces xanthophaeus]
MNTERAPLQYACDITEDDLWEVFEFLHPRLEALEAGHEPGTDEHRTADALARMLSSLVLQLEWDIRSPFWRPYRNGRGPTTVLVWAPPPEAVLRAQDEWRLGKIRENWNALCDGLKVWRDCEGYDPERWRTVEFPDAAAAAEYQRRCDELGLRPRKPS